MPWGDMVGCILLLIICNKCSSLFSYTCFYALIRITIPFSKRPLEFYLKSVRKKTNWKDTDLDDLSDR